MDEPMSKRNEMQAKLCMRNLKSHQFAADWFETGEQALDFLKQSIPAGSSIALGGSETLREIGVLDWLASDSSVHHIDRYHTDDVNRALHDAFNADVYLTSTNALTLDGMLYNVDGTGNRVAALTYGPQKVYVVCGINKLVKDLEEAHNRVMMTAAVANAIRLKRDTPCTQVGYCVQCSREDCICCSEVTTRRSKTKDRIHVLIVNETLGY